MKAYGRFIKVLAKRKIIIIYLFGYTESNLCERLCVFAATSHICTDNWYWAMKSWVIGGWLWMEIEIILLQQQC